MYMKKERDLTVLEIQNLMLETLAYKSEDIDSEGKNFYKYGYKGTQSDLFRLMEALAIKKGILEENIKQGRVAWGGEGYLLHGNSTTNFNKKEINKIYEAFHILLNRGIIAPGAEGNYGPNLPYFHVTEYGLKCLEERDILPYDIDGYMDKLKNIRNIDEWVEFYIKQALECFNAYCYESALIMIGLANEFLVETIISTYINYLKIKNQKELNNFKKQLGKSKKISRKYLKYRESLKNSMSMDADLKNLSMYLDTLANETFMSYMRLTRNELAHPSGIKTDRITTLMIFVAFIKYCERQYIFINYYTNYL